MGTDIHTCVEMMTGGKWTNVFTGARYARILSNVFLDIPRNYDLFAMLADVRNGYGFGGVDTGDGYKPIAQPRGLPDDWDRPPGDKDEDYWLGDHSHTWFTLDELLTYRNNVVLTHHTTHTGVVNVTQFKRFIIDGKPHGYCNGIDGKSIVHVSNDEMERLIYTGDVTDNHYTRIRWEVAYRDQAPSFWGKFIDPFWHDSGSFVGALCSLSDHAQDRQVRVIFGFDS